MRAYAQAQAQAGYALRSSRPGLIREISSGSLAGLVAAVGMAAVLGALSATFLDKDVFYPFLVIGRSAFGDAASHLMAGQVVMAGVLMHGLLALAWGMIFGVAVWCARPRRGTGLFLFGLALGAVAEILDVHVLLPAMSEWDLGTVWSVISVHPKDVWGERIPALVSWLAHIAFGACLSLYPWTYDPMARTFD